MEQHHPLLLASRDAEAGSLVEAGVVVGAPHSGHMAGSRTLWFIQDSCGMVCAGMTWFLVLYAEFVVNFVMLLPSKSFWYSLLNGAAFNSLALLALASHLRAMLTDPVRTVVLGGNMEGGRGWGVWEYGESRVVLFILLFNQVQIP